ncbi:hypothetical protein [African swine fever virus]|uniref:Uncharacterized protein n=1 Tax=African swine fever virus TaxID=10497 RepID=A0A3G1EUV6_ASF|nr:hypothetical protein F8221_gp045 [African swine fever virus]AOO54350.1 hypothetical protein AFSV47Ss_0045 [African swine fever virus]QID21177.1 hypothetical protein AFSV47Ss_0045 [African swine fever virus]QIM06686.1 hypothetical protein [African swine fever virus]QIM06921.1 hypothetical protein [African swine fever virus]QIM07156.1 hypothetical protein [African swine fever virus]
MLPPYFNVSSTKWRSPLAAVFSRCCVSNVASVFPLSKRKIYPKEYIVRSLLEMAILNIIFRS